jgi:hypothetical protein
MNFDGRAQQLEFLRQTGAEALAHTGRNLLGHLSGVAAMLEGWGGRPALRDAGLFHSIYGTEFMRSPMIDAAEREPVKRLIGEEGEEITWLWHSVRRASVQPNVGRETGLRITLRDGTIRPVTRQQLQDIVTLWIADAVEQMAQRGRRAARRMRDALTPLLPLALEPAAAAAREAFSALPRPIVHLYAACWNDADMIPFFLRHYEPWVDRFVIFDDGSTDGSRELLEASGKVELRRLDHVHRDSLVLSLRELYNHAWKESRESADWVVVVNMDEHLYHPDIEGFLEAAVDDGVTAVPALGFEMVGDGAVASDRPLLESVRRGAPRGRAGKLALFAPGEVSEIDYQVGRHRARPRGQIRYPARDELLLLHFKCLSLSRLVARHAEQDSRRRSRDRAEGWGQQYGWSAEESAAWIAELERSAIDVLGAAHPQSAHEEPRWWRPGPRQLVADLAHALRVRGYLPARPFASV